MQAAGLTLEHVRVAMVMHYRTKYGANDDGDEPGNKEEFALSAQAFKGKYDHCGKIGYKAADCPKKKKGSGNSNSG